MIALAIETFDLLMTTLIQQFNSVIYGNKFYERIMKKHKFYVILIFPSQIQNFRMVFTPFTKCQVFKINLAALIYHAKHTYQHKHHCLLINYDFIMIFTLFVN